MMSYIFRTFQHQWIVRWWWALDCNEHWQCWVLFSSHSAPSGALQATPGISLIYHENVFLIMIIGKKIFWADNHPPNVKTKKVSVLFAKLSHPAPIGWVALSSLVCSSVPHRWHLHFISTMWFLRPYKPYSGNLSRWIFLLAQCHFF